MTHPPRADPPATQRGMVRIGRIGGIDITVARSWFLVAGIIAILMAPLMRRVDPDLGNLAYVAGAGFAVLLYLSTLLHELAHAAAARRFDMPVHSINLNFFGGFTAIEERSNTPWREFVVAVVGPLTSLAVGGAAWAGFNSLGDMSLARFMLGALAISNLVVGVLNLVPGLPLDGGRVLLAVVWSVTGDRARATKVAAWGGRVAAVGVIAYPFVLRLLGYEPGITDFIFAMLISSFLWIGATEALATTELRARIPAIRADQLARPAIAVPYELPISEGVRRASEAGAGALVVVDAGGRPTGIVVEQAVRSTPEHRRAWVSVGELSRSIGSDVEIPVAASGEALLAMLGRSPTSEYAVVHPDGSLYGVLASGDVVKAMREGPSR